jgi:hypothetical protein
MIGRVIAWWRSSRAWSADHHVTWPPYTALFDGKSRLMSEAEAVILRAVTAEGFEAVERVEEALERSNHRHEIYVRFRLSPSNVEVWLYPDGAELDAPLRVHIFEEWDFRTPTDFIQALATAAIAMAKQESPPSNSTPRPTPTSAP